MEERILNSLPHINLRVLEEYDSDYSTYVARCLETGTIATADDPESLVEAVKEALTAEIVLAARADKLERLFARPSPPDVWARWLRAVGESGEPKSIALDVWPRIGRDAIPRRGVQSAISIATSGPRSRTA